MQPVQIKNLLFSMVYMISTIIEKKCHHAFLHKTRMQLQEESGEALVNVQ